jgi:Ran GTPase-activating protein (RanGAP) involved in mRNA processing and transport
MSTLQNLSLSNNSIDNKGAIALARSFYNISDLKYLSLNHNTIGNEGASALADSFQYIKQLTELNLIGNNIGNNGAIALADSLKYIQLKYLRLHNNKISDTGAIKLVNSFPNNNKLNILDLSHNYISNKSESMLKQTVMNTYEFRIKGQQKQENSQICIPNVNGSHTTIAECEDVDDTNT